MQSTDRSDKGVGVSPLSGHSRNQLYEHSWCRPVRWRWWTDQCWSCWTRRNMNTTCWLKQVENNKHLRTGLSRSGLKQQTAYSLVSLTRCTLLVSAFHWLSTSLLSFHFHPTKNTYILTIFCGIFFVENLPFLKRSFIKTVILMTTISSLGKNLLPNPSLTETILHPDLWPLKIIVIGLKKYNRTEHIFPLKQNDKGWSHTSTDTALQDYLRPNYHNR